MHTRGGVVRGAWCVIGAAYLQSVHTTRCGAVAEGGAKWCGAAVFARVVRLLWVRTMTEQNQQDFVLSNCERVVMASCK